MRIVSTLALCVIASVPLAAQTIVTPTSPNGWVFFDGSSGSDPATISGAQPFNGNGSLQFTVNASNQQPAAAIGFTPIALSTVTSLTLGYSFLTPTGTSPAASPTIRLLLSGITGNPNSRTDGSLGWYFNGATGSWTTESFSLTSGDFFFRLGGTGQAADDCKSAATSFDDRRQTIADWTSACTGTGNTFDIDTATIVGVEVDWGTFVAAPGATAFADGVNFSIGTTNGSFNFETDAAPVPEPATLSLLATGLVGLAGVARRKRSR